MLSDTFMTVLFPGLRNHTELERSLEGTAQRKFRVELSKRLNLFQHVMLQS